MREKRCVGGLMVGALALLSLGCDDNGGNGAGPDTSAATVEFVYLASTTIDPAVRSAFPGCVGGAGMTHIHPSWRGFNRIDMTPVGAARWEISLSDVPIDQFLRIRVSDPNVCADNPTGAATTNVSANGVLLTEIVDTPGTGTEPGLGFRVNANATVTP